MKYPRPSWSPEIFVDINSIAEKMSNFTGDKKPFSIFKNGTCVFPSFTGEKVNSHCIELLTEVVLQPPNFNVSKMNEGSYLVSFLSPVYSLVLDSEYKNNRDFIIDSINTGGLFPSEELLPSGDIKIPKDHYYIGLFARARLYNDVVNKEIVRHINMS
jgi:hypothetical protein